MDGSARAASSVVVPSSSWAFRTRCSTPSERQSSEAFERVAVRYPPDPFVDADRDEPNGRASGEVPVRDREGRRRILAAGEGDRHDPASHPGGLAVQFPARTVPDGLPKMRLAQVVLGVRAIDHGLLDAPAAVHDAPKTARYVSESTGHVPMNPTLN